MKTFNDIQQGDHVYSGDDFLLSYPVVKINEFNIIIRISEDDLRFVIPKSNNTYYCGMYSCIEAVLKKLENEV